MSNRDEQGLTRVSYGHGGWIRIELAHSRTLVFARLRLVGGYPTLAEVYFDGAGDPVDMHVLDRYEIDRIVKFAVRGELDWLARSERIPGPDLSLLAKTFGTTWGRGTYAGRKCDACGGPVRHGSEAHRDRDIATDDWTALSWFAQYPDSGIPRPRVHERSGPATEPREPGPLEPPRRIDASFLEQVAENYAWAVLTRQRPAPMMADKAGVSRRTVHDWIRRARASGHIPPANRKQKSDG